MGEPAEPQHDVDLLQVARLTDEFRAQNARSAASEQGEPQLAVLGDVAADRLGEIYFEQGEAARAALAVVPTEVMVKREPGFNAATKDWEFFELDVTGAKSTIRTRGIAL